MIVIYEVVLCCVTCKIIIFYVVLWCCCVNACLSLLCNNDIDCTCRSLLRSTYLHYSLHFTSTIPPMRQQLAYLRYSLVFSMYLYQVPNKASVLYLEIQHTYYKSKLPYPSISMLFFTTLLSRDYLTRPYSS